MDLAICLIIDVNSVVLDMKTKCKCSGTPAPLISSVPHEKNSLATSSETGATPDNVLQLVMLIKRKQK